MGLPLNGVLACLYLEFLKSGSFRFIKPKDSNYFHNVDDILLKYTQNNNLTKTTNRLNNIEHSIYFT